MGAISWLPIDVPSCPCPWGLCRLTLTNLTVLTKLTAGLRKLSTPRALFDLSSRLWQDSLMETSPLSPTSLMPKFYLLRRV